MPAGQHILIPELNSPANRTTMPNTHVDLSAPFQTFCTCQIVAGGNYFSFVQP